MLICPNKTKYFIIEKLIYRNNHTLSNIGSQPISLVSQIVLTKPVASPTPTDVPAVTGAPTATDTPTVTDTPIATVAPVSTDTPTATTPADRR